MAVFHLEYERILVQGLKHFLGFGLRWCGCQLVLVLRAFRGLESVADRLPLDLAVRIAT